MTKKKSLRKSSKPASVECYYTIKTVSQLLSLPTQTINYYEEQGLIQSKNLAPAKKSPQLYGMAVPLQRNTANHSGQISRDAPTALYNMKDIETIKRVRRLTEELGVNLPGVEIILHLLEQIEKEHK
jgi:hypothetical protein